MVIFKIHLWRECKTTNIFKEKWLNLIEKNIIYTLCNIKAIKTSILKILKIYMAKRTKLSESEKGEITTLKRVGKS